MAGIAWSLYIWFFCCFESWVLDLVLLAFHLCLSCLECSLTAVVKNSHLKTAYAWSRGTPATTEHSSYTHTHTSHATDTQLSLPLLLNHSFCSKAWNHSPDPLGQETDSQAYSQNHSHTQVQSAHNGVHFSPTYIFPKSKDWPCVSHNQTCTHRLRQHKDTNIKTQHNGITADDTFTWAGKYTCDALTYQDPTGLSGIQPRRPSLALLKQK